jgi:hypothetical protein
VSFSAARNPTACTGLGDLVERAPLQVCARGVRHQQLTASPSPKSSARVSATAAPKD